MSQPFYKIGLSILFIAIISFLVLVTFKQQLPLENSVWRNTEISAYIIEFKRDGTFVEYDETTSFTGTWTYRAPDLTIEIEDEIYRYSVFTLSNDELILRVNNTSEKLSFTPVIR